MKAARDARPDHCGVTVTCDSCKKGRNVDLDALIAAEGPRFSLINRRGGCRFTPGCRGHSRFHYQSGVMRRLWTEEQATIWTDADRERKQLEEKLRAQMVAMMRGRDFRLDPAPRGIEQLLWAVATDAERDELLERRRRRLRDDERAVDGRGRHR